MKYRADGKGGCCNIPLAEERSFRGTDRGGVRAQDRGGEFAGLRETLRQQSRPVKDGWCYPPACPNRIVRLG